MPLLLGGGVAAGVLVGLAAAATATLGDLAESTLKHDLKVKHMDNLLPVHDNVMHRIE